MPNVSSQRKLTREDLYEYQSQAITWLSYRPKAFLALEQGLGKTAVSIYDMQCPVIIICPATLRGTWYNEILTWTRSFVPEHIDIIYDGRQPIIGAWVTIISYELFAKRPVEIMDACRPETLILDESHYLKSPETKRTQAVRYAIKRTNRVRLLSGTPILNRPVEIYPMLKAIGATKIDFWNFIHRYCAAWNAPWGLTYNGASNLEELYTKLSPFMFRRTKKQVLPELPPKIYRVIEFDETKSPGQRELRLNQMFIDKPEHNIDFVAVSDIARMNAERKLPHAISYIKDVLESSHKVIIFAWHTNIVEKLVEALKKYNPVSIMGGTPPQARDFAVEQFQNNDTTRVFVGNIKAAGVGITLTASSHVIFVETTWVPADLEQASDRAHRIGQKDNVLVDILVMRESIDSLMIHKVLDKATIIRKIIK